MWFGYKTTTTILVTLRYFAHRPLRKPGLTTNHHRLDMKWAQRRHNLTLPHALASCHLLGWVNIAPLPCWWTNTVPSIPLDSASGKTVKLHQPRLVVIPATCVGHFIVARKIILSSLWKQHASSTACNESTCLAPIRKSWCYIHIHVFQKISPENEITCT